MLINQPHNLLRAANAILVSGAAMAVRMADDKAFHVLHFDSRSALPTRPQRNLATQDIELAVGIEQFGRKVLCIFEHLCRGDWIGRQVPVVGLFGAADDGGA